MKLRAGFIPLVDAAVLVAAADSGFAEAEGLDLELVREASWANMRDKLNVGFFDAAHLLAPMALAENLSADHSAPVLLAPLVLSQNGNSILLGNDAYAALQVFAEGDLDSPVHSGRALKRLIAERAARNEGKLAFGMTFPFSTHNYLLRFWMAAAGIDPDKDVNLVVVPPPYMVDNLTRGNVNGFCVGAPWPSVGVEAGVGRIIHFGTDIVATCPEKVLAVRSDWATENPDMLNALMRALIRAIGWCSNPENRVELPHMLAAPARLNLSADLILRALQGRLKVDVSGRVREDSRYLVIEPSLARPEERQALWLYAEMVRWKQAPLADVHIEAVRKCFSPDIFDAALASLTQRTGLDDGIGAFAGPPFDPTDIASYIAAIK